MCQVGAGLGETAATLKREEGGQALQRCGGGE